MEAKKPQTGRYDLKSELQFVRMLGTWWDHQRMPRLELLLNYQRALAKRHYDFGKGLRVMPTATRTALETAVLKEIAKEAGGAL